MKRDADLCRQILLELEANPEAIGAGWINLDIEGRDTEEVSYHVQLLHEAGLIVAIDASDIDGLDWRPVRLTAAGHDFLDAARKDTLWQQAKKTAMEQTGGLSLDVLKAVLSKLAMDAVFGRSS